MTNEATERDRLATLLTDVLDRWSMHAEDQEEFVMIHNAHAELAALTPATGAAPSEPVQPRATQEQRERQWWQQFPAPAVAPPAPVMCQSEECQFVGAHALTECCPDGAHLGLPPGRLWAAPTECVHGVSLDHHCNACSVRSGDAGV